MGYSVQFKHISALKFDQGAIEILRTYSMPRWGWVNLLLSSLLMTLPVTKEEILETPITFLRLALMFLAAVVACYLIARTLGSETSFNRFLYTTATVNLFSSSVVMMLTYISLFVFEWWMNNPTLSDNVASVLPFYMFVLFGFSVDGAANLPEKKGILIGAAGICILYTIYYFA